MKTTLITGSTKGIGLEIARQLGEKGFSVWISGRNKNAEKDALNFLRKSVSDANFVLMDVTDIDSIQEAYKTVSARTDSLDVLVNNAAVLLDRPLNILEVAPQVAQKTMQTNVMGVLFVTQIFSRLLKAGSRVINISSLNGQLSSGLRETAPMYCVSKAALNALTIQMNYAFKSRGIIVNSVSPGWVRTDMGGTSADLSVEQGAETPVWLATDAPADKSGLFWREMKEIPW